MTASQRRNVPGRTRRWRQTLVASVVAPVALAAAACSSSPQAVTPQDSSPPASSVSPPASLSPSESATQDAPAPSSSGTSASTQPTESSPASPVPTPESPTAQPSAPGSGQLSQWAATAVASSEFGKDEYSAERATGGAQVKQCEVSPQAWGSLRRDTLETLTLSYAEPVAATEITVFLNVNPGQLVNVSVVSVDGAEFQVYASKPATASECPAELRIPVPGEPVTQTVRLQVDQSATGKRTQVDAVVLTGYPQESL